MTRRFKNALCLARRPDTWQGDPNHCKRKANHGGPHQIFYKTDQKYAVWNDGDIEAGIAGIIKIAASRGSTGEAMTQEVLPLDNTPTAAKTNGLRT